MVYTIIAHLVAKPEHVDKVKAKLIEASRIYRKDKETIDWHVHQDVFDPCKFSVVERFENESSQTYHLNNPYWKTFDPYVKPLLSQPIDLRRFIELDTSKDVEVPPHNITEITYQE